MADDDGSLREAFREAMRLVPAAVTVVTVRLPDGRPTGLVVTAVMSYSLRPPSLAVSISHEARSHAAVAGGTAFGLHFLSRGQTDVATAFASRSADKFARLGWSDLLGVPMLGGCLARFVCRRATSFSHADHTLVIGDVVAIDVAPGAPLVHVDRSMAWELVPSSPRP